MFSIHDEAAVLSLLPANGSRPLLYRQIERALYKDRLEDLGQAEKLPQAIRDKLAGHCRMHELRIRQTIQSANGETTRFLLQADDGALVESVIMRHISGRNTFCLSSQVGCAIGCRFCATGQLGLARDLSTWEIIDQVDLAIRHLASDGQQLRNLVFMGMGEPFLNYEAVSRAISMLTATTKYQFAHKKITVSTCGILDGITRFGQDHPLASLAISLHAPDDDTRSRLMPSLAKLPIASLMACVDEYIARTGRKVFFEYLMIAGLTDQPWQAGLLAGLLKDRRAQANLIPYNAGGAVNEFRPSPPAMIEDFKARLRREGIPVTTRTTMGDDINAACGQLASGG